jgi:hypothetical protein
VSVRRIANPVLLALVGADAAVAVWSVAWLVRAIQAPVDPLPPTNDALLGLLTAAVLATFLLALVLALVAMAALLRLGTRRSTWFILGVLATLIGLPDVVLVMLTAAALALPRGVVLSLLAPALTLVAVITTASFALARPRQP